MKRAIAMSLCALSLSGIIPAAGAANTVTATPTESLGQTVMYDNWPVGISAYNIANNNYFKLRDLGNLLDFAVDYDAATQTVTLGDLSTSYTLVEGEQAKELRDMMGYSKWFVGKPKGMVQPMPATISDSKFSMNGKPVSIAAYSIGGNNYVKLRDVSELVGFGVDFNAASRVVYLSANGETYQEYLANRQAEYAAQQAADEAQKQAEAAEQVASNTPVTDAQLRQWELDMVDRINEERRKAGLNELTIDENLMKWAQYWAQHLTTDFRHSNIDEERSFARKNDLAEKDVYSQENITSGGSYRNETDPVSRHMNNFMNSAGHRNTILDPEWTRVGIGYAMDEDGGYRCCQQFGL